jgi:hypothetical protein
MLIAFTLVVGCGEPQPEAAVVLPDFRGSWVAALEAAEEAHVELNPTGENGSRQPIIDRNAWEVEAQSIEPGEQVLPGTEVEVSVIRTRDREREEAAAARAEEREQWAAEREEAAAAREEERQQRAAEREEAAAAEEQEQEQGDEESRDREGFDYEALIAEQWSTVVPYIDEVRTSATTVTVRLNMGNADGDGIVVTTDGMTDRGMAIDLCELIRRRGVHDAVDILDPRGRALARTGLLDGQCKLT